MMRMASPTAGCATSAQLRLCSGHVASGFEPNQSLISRAEGCPLVCGQIRPHGAHSDSSFQQKRYWPVIDQTDLHIRAKLTTGGRCVLG